MGQLLRPERLVFDLTSLCHFLQHWQNLIDCGLLFLKLPFLWQCSELASQPRGRPFTRIVSQLSHFHMSVRTAAPAIILYAMTSDDWVMTCYHLFPLLIESQHHVSVMNRVQT